MAELRYVDWDGLVYYDGKIKKHIDDLLENCVKMGGPVTADALPDPAFSNLNYIYKVTEEFTANDNFSDDLRGYIYPAGTWVQVTDIDSTYLYTIFSETSKSEVGPDGVDLSNYYTKSEVDKALSTLSEDIQATRDDLEDVHEDIRELSEDVSNLAATKADLNHVHADYVLTDTFDDTVKNINDRLDSIEVPGVDLSDYYTKEETDAKISDIKIPTSISELTNDSGFITEDALGDYAKRDEIPTVPTKVSELTNDAGYLTEHQDISGKLDISTYELDKEDFATKSEIPSLDGYAKQEDIPTVPNKVSEFENDAGYITLKDVPGADLSNYYTKPEVDNLIPDVSEFLKEVPSEYITETELESKGYLTEHQDISGKADKEHTHEEYALASDLLNKADKVHEHTDYLTAQALEGLATEQFVKDSIDAIEIPETDLSNYYTKEETETLVNDTVNGITIPDTTDMATKTWVGEQKYLVESDVASKADKTDIVTTTSGLTNDAGFTTLEEVAAVGYIKQENLNDYALKTDLGGLATEQYVDDAISNLDIPEVDTSNLVTTSQLEEALGEKANDVPFTADMRVGSALGGFVADESLKDMTISAILIKLLALKEHAEDIPEGSSELVKSLIENEVPTYMLGEDGSLVEVPFVYKTMTTEEAEKDDQENSFFYQIVEDDGTIVESGYQIATIYQENDWLTVCIPNEITEFSVLDYDAMAGAWTSSTWSLVENPNSAYAKDGYTAYTVSENYEIMSGISIRIVITE